MNDLSGRTFGRLKVRRDYRIVDGKAEWLCDCKCGQRVWVRGTKMVRGEIVSCGCAKADPEVRRAARFVTPPAKRQEIAKLGGKARHAS